MAVKETAIAELKEIDRQLQDIISQLEKRDIAYYKSSEIASMIPAITGMEWGCGTNPDNGVSSFTAYFRKY